MALQKVKGGSGLSLTTEYMSNAQAFIKEMRELSAEDIETEEQLNALRISNVKYLGQLRRKQQQEVLKASIEAENKVIEERLKLQQESLDQEQALRERAAAAENGNGKLTKKQKDKIDEEFKRRKQHLVDQAEWEKKNAKQRATEELHAAKRKAIEEAKAYKKEKAEDIFGAGKDIGTRINAIKNVVGNAGVRNEDGTITKSKGAALGAAMSVLTSALSDFAKSLENTMEGIASKKSAVDTRLQGSKNAKSMGSYWDQMTKDITGVAGVSPLVKQEALSERVTQMVSQGIAFNVEQRAALDVLKDKIATTFDAANGTLLRLVRVQQQDTTAARLGMESALTAFLNNMYETTEYMQGLAVTVKGSLEEAMSLMSGENALSFEYQIQKWLGSLYSVGMSDNAVQGLAGVLGQVASGKIEGLTSGSGQGNLVIMAANNAGLNISDILANGMDQTTTNTLLDSMVDYLAKMYNEAGNSKVIQQQIANVYGMSASDLKAAVNLSKSRNTVSRDGLDYNSAMARLNSMANTMYQRTSMGEMMSNMWNNVQYSMAAGMASNPVTYGLYKMSGLLEDVTGGIDFALPLVMGSGTAQTFNVAELMRTAALSGGIISSIAQMAMAGGGGGFTGSGILKALGVNNGMSYVSRGTGQGLSTAGGATVSESGSMVGNSNSDDVTNKTMTDQTDSSKSETASAVDESDEVKLSTVDTHILDILDVLTTIRDGGAVLNVKVTDPVALEAGSLSIFGSLL